MDLAPSLNYTQTRAVLYHGQSAIQEVGQAQVVLTRKAKPKKIAANGKRVVPVPGAPLPVRLVVSRVYLKGRCVAEWFILTNLPASIPAGRIALWYYYRWNIESFFKTLKSAGLQLESWQQETAQAVARRLLIATQACALAWRLMRQQTAEADEARTFLVRLAGRQMKRTRPVTLTALMDGIFSLLTMLEALKHYSIEQLEAFAQTLLQPQLE
ncbi:IS4 family transposase ISRba2 [Paraburkholderia aspalathi]|nr:IS4 family transposase ISRba2 [Paraburkholderia aspalathi]